jgi:hypothetical protein
MPYPNPHEPRPAPERRRPEEPRDRRESPVANIPGVPPATQAPDEPVESARSLPTPTRTIRDGEIQGHEREMPGDRDSQ